MSDLFKNALLWLVILGVLILIFSNLGDHKKPSEMNYSEFVAAVNAGQIKQVTIDGEKITGEKKNGSDFESIRPAVQDPELMPSLIKNNVVVEGTAPQRQGVLMQLLIASFPVLLIILLFMFFMRNMGGGAGGKNGPMSFGKSKAKMLSAEEVEHLVGHGIGGVCPFAVNSNVDIYLDDSLKRFETVFPACGSSNSAIELTIAELEKYSNSVGWFDLCKGWQPVKNLQTMSVIS